MIGVHQNAWLSRNRLLNPNGACSSEGQSGRLIIGWSMVRVHPGPPPQHLVSIKPRCGVGAGFVVACSAVSDMTTGLVTIQIGCCPSLDAMNTGNAAVTWLSTVGIGSIRVRRFARGWRPCNGGWDEVGRR